jgi:hypothetical protein
MRLKTYIDTHHQKIRGVATEAGLKPRRFYGIVAETYVPTVTEAGLIVAALARLTGQHLQIEDFWPVVAGSTAHGAGRGSNHQRHLVSTPSPVAIGDQVSAG